ncbi:MAG: hypothetical protein Q8O87_03010 [bacterium]|nr:hypothetical protein [bacterium]
MLYSVRLSGLTIEELLQKGGYSSVSPVIDEVPAGYSLAGVTEARISLIHLDSEVETGEVLRGLKANAVTPVNLRLLLELGWQFPYLQKEYPIVGLGSQLEHSPGNYLAPYLGTDSLQGEGNNRIVSLHMAANFHWAPVCRFATVIV